LIVKNVGDFVSALAGSLTSVATNLVLRLFDLGFTVLCCFFFLRDGETLVARVEEMLPFSKHRQQVVLHRFDQVVTGSIYGNTAVALLEGVVGGSAFYAAGLHSPALWGTVMGLLSYLPVGGAALIWVPGAVYLFYQAAYVKCAGLCLAGVLIAVIDHAVRNALLAHRVRLHPLLVFCSVLGGVQLFGLLGLVVGPLIVAIAQTMLDVFRPALAEAAQHPAEGP
jgi:predicted PurR-regulated permease PerM